MVYQYDNKFWPEKEWGKPSCSRFEPATLAINVASTDHFAPLASNKISFPIKRDSENKRMRYIKTGCCFEPLRGRRVTFCVNICVLQWLKQCLLLHEGGLYSLGYC